MKSIERQLHISLAIVLMIILTGLLVFANFSSRNMLQTFVTSRLDHDAMRILDALVITPNSLYVKSEQLDAIYKMPNSGHYFALRINTPTPRLLKSESLQDQELVIPHVTTETTLRDIEGPQGQRLIIRVKHYQKDGHDVLISIAEDMTRLIEKRQHFRLLFISIGLVGFVSLLLLQQFVIRRQFKQLDRSRAELKQIETGKRQQLSEDVPTEIYPLVKEFNHSLSIMQQRMERSRHSLGNLAHALKTPLSILMQNLTNKAAIKQAERIRQLTDRELKRARMAGLGNTNERFNPHNELPTLIDVLKQSHQKNNLEVSLNISDSVTHFGDREDMLELLGNLMDNAFKWAKSRVMISLLEKQAEIHIIIEDDGTGKKVAKLDQLTQRGTRLDETVEGHGLGLAICKDIVKLYGGSIHFGRSKNLGGFLTTISIPLFRSSDQLS